MPTVYTLPTNHADGVSEVITAALVNDLASAANEMSARRPMYWPRHISGSYHGVADMLEGGAANSIAMTVNKLYAFWMPIPEANVTYDRIDINVSTAAAGGKIARLISYADDGSAGRPSTLLTDFGTVAVDSTGIKTITISFVPPHGGFWLAVVSDGAPVPWASGGDRVKPLGQDSSAGAPWRGWSFANGGTTAPSPFPSGAALDSSVFTFYIRMRRA